MYPLYPTVKTSPIINIIIISNSSRSSIDCRYIGIYLFSLWLPSTFHITPSIHPSTTTTHIDFSLLAPQFKQLLSSLVYCTNVCMYVCRQKYICIKIHSNKWDNIALCDVLFSSSNKFVVCKHKKNAFSPLLWDPFCAHRTYPVYIFFFLFARFFFSINKRSYCSTRSFFYVLKLFHSNFFFCVRPKNGYLACFK